MKRCELYKCNAVQNIHYDYTNSNIVLTDRTRWQQQLCGGVRSAVPVGRETRVRARVRRALIVIVGCFNLQRIVVFVDPDMVDPVPDLHFLAVQPRDRYRRAIVRLGLAFEADRIAVDKLDVFRRSRNLCWHCKKTGLVISVGIRTSELGQHSVSNQSAPAVL